MTVELRRYAELAAGRQLRSKVLSDDATVVFSRLMDRVLWANGEGASLFGGGGIAALLDTPVSRGNAFIRQLQDAAAQIEGGQSVVRGFRIARGFASQLIQCELQPIDLSGDEEGLLLTCAPMAGAGKMREHERARSAVDALEGAAIAVAIVDGHGLPLAASDGYADVPVDQDTIEEWLEGWGEDEQSAPAFKSIEPLQDDAAALNVYMARLSEKPPRFLLAFGETSDQRADTDILATDLPADAAAGSDEHAGAAPVGLAAAGFGVGALAAGATSAGASPVEAEEGSQETVTEDGDATAPMEPRTETPEAVDEATDAGEAMADHSRDEAVAGSAAEADESREAEPATDVETETPPPDQSGGMHQEVEEEAEAVPPPGGTDAAGGGDETAAGEATAPDDDARTSGADTTPDTDSPTGAEDMAGAAQRDESWREQKAASTASTDRGRTAPQETERPQPIRSLLERWFMRRGDEEIGAGEDEAAPTEASGSNGANGKSLEAEQLDADQDAGDDARERGGVLAATAAIAAGAGLAATSLKDDRPDGRDDGTEPEASETDDAEMAEPVCEPVEAFDDDTASSQSGTARQKPEEKATPGVTEIGGIPDEDGPDHGIGAAGFVFSADEEPVRFAWTTDSDQVFVSVSPELAETLGPNAADIVGRKWSDVATVFGFDERGEISQLLEHRDTWSGKSVLWPVQGTDLVVPVDLAALPAFNSSRSFEGFRGFGIIRAADAVVDPQETGLALSANPPEAADDEIGETSQQIDEDEIERRQLLGARIRHDEDDQSALADRPAFVAGGGRVADNVVDIASRKRAGETVSALDEDDAEAPVDDRTMPLTGREAQAFQEIGRRLGRESDDMRSDGNEAAPGHDEAQTVILEQLPVPVVVYRNGHTLFANRELLDATGYRSTAEIDEAGGVEALFGGGEVNEGSNSALQLRRRDGGEMQVSPLLKSVPWAGGRALLLTFRPAERPDADVRAAIDIARVSELQQILDTAADGIVIADADGIVESINRPAEALLGMGFDDAAGSELTGLFAHESHSAIRDYMAQTADAGLAGTLNDGREVIGKKTDGNLVPLFLTLGRMGQTGKLCAVLRDLTKWKKAEEEMVEARHAAETASEQKSDFLARVSHEIRTPLNAIIGFSDVMIEERFGSIDNERYREYLRDINRSGIHILDLINDLLDISKIEAGKMELSFEAVDLNRIVAETVALLQPQANVERIIIRTSLSRAVPRVVADARTIRQIILNLVSNAIKFTSMNGQVIVSTVYETNGEVVLKVRDTGRGMSDSELEQALKPFGQIGVVEERRGQGTGLGLPLTKALVEANRAHFDLESSPGKGTIAHVQFPTQRVLAD